MNKKKHVISFIELARYLPILDTINIHKPVPCHFHEIKCVISIVLRD